VPELRQRARGERGGGERQRLALIALTSDESLLEALESVLANESRLHVVDRETELAVALMDPRIGVALLDADKLKSPLEELTQRLHNQFPDLILVVAGGTHQQAAIADQVASGTIYRFLHKPVSEQRVKLFVEAAMRRHETTPARGAGLMALPPGYSRTAPSRAVLMVCAALLATAAITVWQLSTAPDAGPMRAHGGARGAPPPPVASDPRLADARAALARGELVTPIGRSAADLYRAVLADSPDDSEAHEGLEQVIGELCSLAEREVTAGRLEEAARYLESARRLDPHHVRIAFIATEIENERARATLAAHQAMARSHPAPTSSDDESSTPEVIPAAKSSPAAAPPAAPPAAPTVAPPKVATATAVVAATAPLTASPLTAPPPASPLALAPAPAPIPSPPPRSVVSASTLQRTRYREPRYPEAARAKNLGGWVDLEFTVRADGSVAAVQAVGAEPEGVFEQAAIEAVSGWHYLPVLRDGAPVSQRASVRIRFSVER
jgi:protein TonB